MFHCICPRSVVVDVESVVGTAAAKALAVDGFVLEFVAGDGGLRRERLPAAWWLPFEQVWPVRRFPSFKGQRNFPGWWWSATTGRHVDCESWLERDHAMLLDFDPLVVGYASQPFWLSWTDDERVRRHAPDFFARMADGGAVVIDVRADDRIEPRDAEAFAATARACEQVGWRYRRVGQLPAAYGRNVRWLSRYRHRRCAGPDGLSDVVVEVFTEPTELLVGAAAAGDTLATLPVVYHLLWCQVLTTNLSEAALGPSTLVWRTEGGRS